jgi:MoxR-like ATPase
MINIIKMKIKKRIEELLKELNQDVFEKEEITRLSLLSAVAGESIFLLGAPGVAKSLIARRLKFAFQDANSFEYLMNKFSTPDEIFGPISIKKLKDEDKYERLTEKYLPSSNIIFLDEIWKAGPSIQNTLLTILNEKKYRNGDQEIDCKIYGVIAASNELPENNQGLEALWDRFLIRYNVEGISDKGNFNRMITGNLKSYEDNITIKLKIKNDEIEKWSKQIDEISIPEEVLNVIHFLRSEIQVRNKKNGEEENIYISDRRWRKIVRLLRTSSFLNDRIAVDLMDCFLIAFCIWNEQEELEKFKEMVSETIKKHGYGLNLNLNVISQQIKEFNESEVIEGIQTKTEYKENEIKIIKGTYYEIEGLVYNTTYNLIKIADYKKISSTQTSYTFYDASGNSHNMTAYLNGDNIMIASNSWDTCKLKTQIVTKTKILEKAPTPITKKAWDNQITSFTKLIQVQIDKVENHKEGQLAHLRTNIFVESSLAEIVETNLNNIVKDLEGMKIEVEKIKSYYDNIK